jgi:hypothetical protein
MGDTRSEMNLPLVNVLIFVFFSPDSLTILIGVWMKEEVITFFPELLV